MFLDVSNRINNVALSNALHFCSTVSDIKKVYFQAAGSLNEQIRSLILNFISQIRGRKHE